MLVRILEALRIYQHGEWDVLRMLLYAVPVLLFLLWRLSSHGVYGADEVERAITRDLLAEYKESVYRRYGLYAEDVADSSPEAKLAAVELDGLDVELTNVAMSGSLFGWAANDEIGVRFDYSIKQHGEIKAQEDNVYRCSRRQSRTSLWNCGTISYYLKYF